MSFTLPFFLKKKKHEPTREPGYPTLASMVQAKQSPNPSPTSSSSSRSRPASVALPTPTPPLEPEDLEDSRFYRYIRSHFNPIFSRSAVVCIPHSRSLEGLVLTKDFIETHCYNASPYYRGQCQAANGKVIAIEPPLISTVSGFKEPRTVHVIAEESVYITNKKICVLMIERPLEGEPPQTRHNAQTIAIPTERNFKSDLHFLNMFPENAEALHELQLTVQEFVDTYVYIRGFNAYTVEKIQNIYVQVYKTIQQRNKLLRDACRIQSEHDYFLELVENVVMGFLHEKIWIRSLRSILQSQDNYIDSICRSYAKDTVTLHSYAVSHLIAEMPLSCFDAACACLRRVDSEADKASRQPAVKDDTQRTDRSVGAVAYTPLEKVACVKLTLDLISAAVMEFVRREAPHASDDDSFVTTDEMIPLLAYVLVHSRIPRIASLAFYIEHFRLSHMERSEHSFALVTLKTAIEFLRGDPLSLHDASSDVSTLSNTSTSSTVLSPQIQNLRSRSTSVGSPMTSPLLGPSHPPPPTHYRSVSMSSRQNLASLSASASPSSPALTNTTRALRHRKSHSADLHGLMTSMQTSTPQQVPSTPTPQQTLAEQRRNSLTPQVVIRQPISLHSPQENRRSLDISADWSVLEKYQGAHSSSQSAMTSPTFSQGYHSSALSHSQPLVSTTFPSLSNSSPLPTQGKTQVAETQSSSEKTHEETHEPPACDTHKLNRSMSASTMKSITLQPPKVIDIRDRLSYDNIRRPASICLDTRSVRTTRSHHEDNAELMGDFLHGLQSMDGDIVGERSGSFRAFSRW